jgi:hypothetical protein
MQDDCYEETRSILPVGVAAAASWRQVPEVVVSRVAVQMVHDKFIGPFCHPVQPMTAYMARSTASAEGLEQKPAMGQHRGAGMTLRKRMAVNDQLLRPASSAAASRSWHERHIEGFGAPPLRTDVL